MPVKILTDQPDVVSRLETRVLGTTYETLVEPPYFSRTGVAVEEVAVLDPADANRELLGGEVFFQTPLLVTNVGSVDTLVFVQIVRENGTTVVLASGQRIEGNDTLQIPIQGQMLFKRNLANPGAAGDRLQARASAGAVLHIALSYAEKEALLHAPNTDTVV